jgi:protein O-GlcNAc transferase
VVQPSLGKRPPAVRAKGHRQVSTSASATGHCPSLRPNGVTARSVPIFAPENVEKLRNFGFEAYSDDIENIAAIERFSVVSMADVLEHVPFPRRSLAAVHRMMRPGGALFVSMPNMDSIIWRSSMPRVRTLTNGELEHYRNFTRARLVRLLESQGFKFAEYNVSERYRTRMEVIALKI